MGAYIQTAASIIEFSYSVPNKLANMLAPIEHPIAKTFLS
jgi:hypothetical protein